MPVVAAVVRAADRQGRHNSHFWCLSLCRSWTNSSSPIYSSAWPNSAISSWCCWPTRPTAFDAVSAFHSRLIASRVSHCSSYRAASAQTSYDCTESLTRSSSGTCWAIGIAFSAWSRRCAAWGHRPFSSFIQTSAWTMPPFSWSFRPGSGACVNWLR